MDEEYKQTTYLDMGFDAYMLKLPIQNSGGVPQPLQDVLENYIRNRSVKDISADKITAGTLSAQTKVGDDSIILDGENRVIKILDGAGNVSVYIKGGSA